MTRVHKLAPVVLLSNDEKKEWFRSQINERQRTNPFQNESEVIAFIKQIRKSFKAIYNRDVPGYFIRKLIIECGIDAPESPRTALKREFAWRLMDRNKNYRENKTQLAKALEEEFGEKTLNYILNDIFEGYHNRDDKPEPECNIDLYGQNPLFG